MTFTIPGRIPSLNVITRNERNPRYRFYGSRQRSLHKRRVATWIIAAGVPHFKTQVEITVKWVELDRRRDYDNISSGVKVILDALVATQRIPNDSQKWLRPVKHEFDYDKKNPRIEVTIEEAA